MQSYRTFQRFTCLSAAACGLILALRPTLAGPDLAAPPGSIVMELIAQAQVFSPQTAIFYGYLSHVAGLDGVFTGTPENESTAVFTYYLDVTTTRVVDNGPLRIVNREGTATFYLNPSAGAGFADPESFRSGTPIMTAHFRQQVVLDVVQGNFSPTFDLTITAAEHFWWGGHQRRLGKPGQKLSWIAYGRAVPEVPGLFAVAGFGLSGQ
jgi:hypothetical protein